MTCYYATPALRIGDHEWRCIVVPFWLDTQQRATRYQFRLPGGAWRSHREWPNYDINEGMQLGLPKQLSRLYRDYRGEIEFHLSPGTRPDPRLSLEQLKLPL